MSTIRGKRKNRYPFLPLLLFLITYALVQLYYYNYTLFAIFIATALFTLGIFYAWKSYRSDKIIARSLNKLESMNAEQFLHFVAVLFRRQGYTVKKNKHSFVHLIIRKGKAKIIVHLHQSEESCQQKIEELCKLKSIRNANRAMLVTNRPFTKEELTLAKANKINLLDKKTLEAMFDVHLDEKQSSFFIERIRTLFSKEKQTEI